MTTFKQDINTLYRASPAGLATGLLAVGALFLSFFLPAVQAGILAHLAQGTFTWALVLQWGLVAVVFGSFFMVHMGMKKTDQGSSLFLTLLTALFFVFIPSVFAVATSNYEVVLSAQESKQKVEEVEERLGRTTPLGDRIRQSMQPLPALLESEALVRDIYEANADPDAVIKILSLAPVMGQDHPVIQYAIENGMAKKDSASLLYRDLVERMRSDPDMANDPDVRRALAVIASTD